MEQLECGITFSRSGWLLTFLLCWFWSIAGLFIFSSPFLSAFSHSACPRIRMRKQMWQTRARPRNLFVFFLFVKDARKNAKRWTVERKETRISLTFFWEPSQVKFAFISFKVRVASHTVVSTYRQFPDCNRPKRIHVYTCPIWKYNNNVNTVNHD